MGRYKHKPVKPKYKKEGEGFWRKTKPRDRIVGKSRAAKGGGTEPLPSEQSKVDRRGRKAAAASKGTKSTIGRGKHGVRYEYLIPEHMKAPEKKVKKGGEGMGFIKEAAKRTKETKPAPHMVRHTKAPAKAKRAAASFTEKAGVAQDIGPWKPTDRKATKPKVSYKKPKKTPFGMKKGGSVKKKSKSSVGGGKQGVKTVTPKHMKAPPAKRTKGTKAAPHMVKHSMGSLTGITTAEDWSKMRKMDAELDREWEKAVPSSYQGKGHGRKVVHGNKGAHRKRKGGSVDAQWGGYDFKDGGRIPGIRPTRKGT